MVIDGPLRLEGVVFIQTNYIASIFAARNYQPGTLEADRMSRRQQPSLEKLSDIIGDIHDAATAEEQWPALMRRIGYLFNAPTATVWKRTGSGEFKDIFTFNTDERFIIDYAGYYFRLDKLHAAVMRAESGIVMTNSSIVGWKDFVNSEFYCDFALRHDLSDCLQARVFDSARFSGYVGITASSRSDVFERNDIRLLRLLLPHLARAMEVQRRFTELGVARESALQALDLLRDAVFLVDPQGVVVHVNQAAEGILQKGSCLALDRGSKRLRSCTAAQTVSLQRLIAAMAAMNRGDVLASTFGIDKALRLDCGDAGVLLLRAVPLRAGAAWNVSAKAAVLLLVSEPDRGAAERLADDLRGLFGLTPTEASVAAQIGQATSVDVAAEALKITAATLRWHLKHVFEKTGTTRQAELTRLVERLGNLTDRPRA